MTTSSLQDFESCIVKIPNKLEALLQNILHDNQNKFWTGRKWLYQHTALGDFSCAQLERNPPCTLHILFLQCWACQQVNTSLDGSPHKNVPKWIPQCWSISKAWQGTEPSIFNAVGFQPSTLLINMFVLFYMGQGGAFKHWK